MSSENEEHLKVSLTGAAVSVDCTNCGDAYAMKVPSPLKTFQDKVTSFRKAHKDCAHPDVATSKVAGSEAAHPTPPAAKR
jgi:hypothetical protein